MNKKILIGICILSLVLLGGCIDEGCRDICYLRGNMDGSEVDIKSSTGDDICVFPFNYTVKDTDDLYVIIEEECK